MVILPTAKSEVDKLLKELEAAKKDEQEAQTMYQNVAAHAGMVGNIGDLPFMRPVFDIYREILKIRDQEREHEQKFNRFISEVQTARQKLIEYLEKEKKEEERKKSQTKSYGRRY